jgi:hypothetical protein
MRRISLLLITGLAVGLAIGLAVGWLILPVQYVDSPMRDLAPQHKDDYTVMVAAAFQVDRDLAIALERLLPLRVENVPIYVRDVTERFISQQGTGREADIRNLVELSCALGYCTDLMQAFRTPNR